MRIFLQIVDAVLIAEGGGKKPDIISLCANDWGKKGRGRGGGGGGADVHSIVSPFESSEEGRRKHRSHPTRQTARWGKGKRRGQSLVRPASPSPDSNMGEKKRKRGGYRKNLTYQPIKGRGGKGGAT